MTAAKMYATIVVYINTGRLAEARALTFTLLDFTLQQYNAGKLIGGYSSTTQARLLHFETGLYCTVGLPATGLVLPGDPSDGGTVDKVVYPSADNQNLVTQNGNAGVHIPGGALSGPVLVTIVPLSGNPLNTTLPQFGPFSDVKVSPESALLNPVSVGICPSADVVPATVFLAHNNSATTIEILPRGDFISGLCGITVPPTGLRKVFDLGKNGDFASATRLIGSALANMLLPTTANATGGGITGTTKKFSPFGGVDTGAELIPYGASYQYLIGAHDVSLGFEAPDYSTTDWSTGSGAFGSLGSTACPIFSDTQFPLRTNWPIDTDLLLRTTFSLPAGWSTPLTISAAIDNDVIVYVNGHPLTIDGSGNPLYTFPANGSYSFDPASGFVSHENCAQRGELTFTVPASYLVSGSNVLAIRGRDRGSVDYLDVEVKGQTPQ
ncbi:MAG TPA: hypothetical protein VLI43_02050 [Gemmatimonadaceae bacterium]|nr:hypothetical protein [Gemmatimonadaceae bacterium]